MDADFLLFFFISSLFVRVKNSHDEYPGAAFAGEQDHLREMQPTQGFVPVHAVSGARSRGMVFHNRPRPIQAAPFAKKIFQHGGESQG